MNPTRVPALSLGAVLAALVLAWAPPAAAAAPVKPSLRPVPSLEPAATQQEWRRLVRTRRPFAAAADCRPLRAVFYAATDWLRLATRLAAAVSPCAHYYVSIPPLAANKTQPRADQAWRIRALGPGFHAMAEIHMASWGAWVSQNGGSWYAAGQEARRRMAAAGYDVALGDSWALNELSSAVRRGDGAARATAREFIRGLFDGGALPDVRGAVFTTGMGQGTNDLSLYKANLQSWLSDASFWQDMATHVEDWAQELYGDVRNYAVPGADLAARGDALNQYLQHELALARAGSDFTAAARSYLETAYSPLANAAWQWDSAFGWTDVASDQMQHYVSAQTYALRRADLAAGRSRDHWGFAWAPRNAAALAPADFTAQTGAILDRLAAAIRDSGASDVGACGSSWCGGDLAGAWFNAAWSTFAVWTSHALAFTTPPQTLTAGVASAPIAVQLQANGSAQAAGAPLTVALTATSPTGTFSASASGPWSATLAVTIPGGGSTSEGFYYLDTAAGTATVIAAAPNVLGATQTLVVNPVAPPPPPTGRQPDAQSLPRKPVRIVRRGTARRDVLVGGPLGDRLYGRGGNDVLRGRGGNDLLDGGAGRDRILGGPGADRIRARDRRVDVIHCGPGRDVVVADRRDRIGRGCERLRLASRG